METKVTKNQIKKNAVKATETILKSPFAVMNVINKNRDDKDIKALLDMYGVEKIQLSDLFTLYDYCDRNVFCKLQKTTLESAKYAMYGTKQIGKTLYEIVPIKFTVVEFLKSYESMIRIRKENEKTAAAYEKLFANSEKKKKESAAKKAANRSAKVAAKAKELKEKFNDLPDQMIMRLAEEFFKAA